jgi:hypothetical protein
MSAGIGVVARTALHPARPLVVGALLLRAVINVGFMAWLLAYSPGWVDVFDGGAFYAIADGMVGVALVLLIGWLDPIGAPPTLLAMTSIDALLRLAAGAAILVFPGIPDIPVTLVLFYGVLGAWAATAGIIAIVAAEVAHEHARAGTSPGSTTRAMFQPFSVEGVIALLLAVYALVVGPPSTAETLRLAASVACGSFALVLLIAAFRVARRSPVVG